MNLKDIATLVIQAVQSLTKNPSDQKNSGSDKTTEKALAVIKISLFVLGFSLFILLIVILKK